MGVTEGKPFGFGHINMDNRREDGVALKTLGANPNIDLIFSNIVKLI
jgi:hypothetical protein